MTDIVLKGHILDAIRVRLSAARSTVTETHDKVRHGDQATVTGFTPEHLRNAAAELNEAADLLENHDADPTEDA